ncbi:MAG: TIGR01459 family HAD-type hydrolase [Candidatus Puniceispirillum sp.]|nr:TIGR01459 family HAD-type hydrolase [Candidatus Pelagibacter sp.]MBA4282906.1 TIGR01459 family HAD-type hydrolase [Candidatus Puniceispirillum sp.]
MKNNRLTELELILESFDVFIFDIWGVIHNGKKVYRGIIDKFKLLKKHNKTIIIASNSPRPSSTIKKVLESKGLDSSLYDYLITSGEVFLHDINLNKCPYIDIRRKPKALLVDENIDDVNDELVLLIHEKFHIVEQIEEADVLIALTITKNKKIFEEKYTHITDCALHKNIPFYCVNADIVVYEKEEPIIRPGYWAGIYNQLGGHVIYYGKPHHKIYEYIFELISAHKDRILMIGDSLDTDILGAHKMEIQSALVLNKQEKIPFYAPFTNRVLTNAAQPNFFFPNWES